MKFRYPNFAIIKGTMILFLLIYIVAFGILKFIGMQPDIIIFYFLISSCSVICIVEYIFLNIWWQSIVFDEMGRKVIITKNIFSCPVKKQEIPFKEIIISLSHDQVEGGGGYLWKLNLASRREEAKTREELEGNGENLGPESKELFFSDFFTIAHGLRAAPLRRKKEEIENLIKMYGVGENMWP